MTQQTPASKWSIVRDDLKTKRAARVSLKALERDLASYGSPSEVAELNAIVSRYDGPEVEQIREILSRHRVA
jgi:hypothetical protein